MPTPYQYALFSLDVYQDRNDHVVLPSNWAPLLKSPENLNTEGYFGIAYINRNTKEIVIAHRGTNDLYDIFKDDGSLFLQWAPPQFLNSARPFIQLVKDNLSEHSNIYGFGYTFSFTGHSLGASLAEISAAQENVPAVTFDSPGTVPIINTLMSDGQLPADALSKAHANTKTYLANPNLVNTLHPHLGTFYRVYPPYNMAIPGDPTSAISYSLYYTILNQHKMGGLLAQFNQNTGLPQVWSQPTSWPVGTLVSTSGYNNYLNYAKNPYFWNQYIARQWSLSLNNGATNFKAFRDNFIKSKLTGFDQIVSGVTITGDDSGNDIWGAGLGLNIINGGAGRDTLRSFAGDDSLYGGGNVDTYVFDENGFGRDTVIDPDLDGVLRIGEQVISGTAIETANQSGTYVFNMDNINVFSFSLKRVSDDLMLTREGTDSILLKNYFLNNDNGSSTRFGITLKNAVKNPVGNAIPAGSDVNTGINAFGDGNYAISWVASNEASQTSQFVLAVHVLGHLPYPTFFTINAQYAKYSPPTVQVFPSWWDDSSCFRVVAYAVRFGTMLENSQEFNLAGGYLSLIDVTVCAGTRAGGNIFLGKDIGCITQLGNEFIITGIENISHNLQFTQNCYDFSGNRVSGNNPPSKYNTAVNLRLGGNSLNLMQGGYEDGPNGLMIYTKQSNNVFLSPEDGDNSISGSSANDVIIANGDTLISGNGGADKFVFLPTSNARANIIDFDPVQQKIDLSAYRTITSINDFMITAGSAVVNLPNNQTIHINNLQGTLNPQNLTADNFIFALPNQAPQSNCSEMSIVASFGAPINLNPATCIIEPDGDRLMWALSDTYNNTWLQQDPLTGLITGILPENSSFTGAIVAADPWGLSTSIPLNITGVSLPPVMTGSGTSTGSESLSSTASATATGVSYTGTGDSASATGNSESSATGSASSTGSGSHHDNHAPVVTHTIPSQQVQVNELVALNIDVFTDPDGDLLALSAFQSDGSALPSWLDVSSTAKILSGIPPSSQNLNITVQAKDPQNAVASTAFSLQVSEPVAPNRSGFFDSMTNRWIVGGVAVGAALAASVLGFFGYKQCKKSAATSKSPAVTDLPPGGSQIQLAVLANDVSGNATTSSIKI